jgi:hypothetical protein
MENEIPLIHHAIEWQGCDCIIKDDKSLNEKVRKYLMTQSTSKLMKARWEQRKILNWDGHKGLN